MLAKRITSYLDVKDGGVGKGVNLCFVERLKR